MTDIVPEMLENIMTDFDQRIQNSPLVSRVKGLLDEGKATYDEANAYSLHLGEMLSGSLQKYITPDTLPDGKMYYNIADRILGETMTKDHELISEVATQVQQSLNEAGGLGIKALTPPVNNDRIKGLVDKVSNAEQFEDVAWVLGEPMLNFSQSIVDDTVKLNADFQGKAGLQPVIVRRTDRKPCDWCKNLAGTYAYPEVPAEVYMRHRFCQCTVEYRPGNKRAQNVWSKKWSDETTEELLEARKTIGLKKGEALGKPLREKNVDYIKAQTKEKAVENAKKYARKVDFKRLDVDMINRINGALEKNFSEKIQKLSEITVLSPKTKLGLKALPNNAIASYDIVYNRMFINGDIMKNAKTYEKFVKDAVSDMDSMKDMPRAVIEKLSSAQKNFYDDFLKIGRGEVDSLSLDGIISHEYGHHIDITSLRKMDKSRSYYENFESKAMKLSAYARTSQTEYIAESYAAYFKGERENVDGALLKMFDELMGG